MHPPGRETMKGWGYEEVPGSVRTARLIALIGILALVAIAMLTYLQVSYEPPVEPADPFGSEYSISQP